MPISLYYTNQEGKEHMRTWKYKLWKCSVSRYFLNAIEREEERLKESFYQLIQVTVEKKKNSNYLQPKVLTQNVKTKATYDIHTWDRCHRLTVFPVWLTISNKDQHGYYWFLIEGSDYRKSVNHSPAFFHRYKVLKQLQLRRVQFHQEFLFLSCICQLVHMLNYCKKSFSQIITPQKINKTMLNKKNGCISLILFKGSGLIQQVMTTKCTKVWCSYATSSRCLWQLKNCGIS